MESPTKATENEAAEGAANERSTIDWPYIDLDNAVEVAKGVHEVGGTACEYDQLAAALEMEAKGGGFRTRVTGAKMYGLVTYERGGRTTLTELGRQVADPQQERAARVKAFLQVPLFERVYETFKGGPLPPQAGLNRAITGFGVGQKNADRARQVLMRSAKQAGFFELKPDRLIAPPVREGYVADQQQDTGHEESQERRFGSGGGGNDDLHPLIRGLLMTLPKQTGPWAIQDRANWLSMANSIFKMIYPAQGEEDVDITLRKPQGSSPVKSSFS